MRGRMTDGKRSVPPSQFGEPMEGGAICEVVESQAEGFAAGDLVLHMAGWRDEDRGRALFEREDQGSEGPHILDRSFEGTYRG